MDCSTSGFPVLHYLLQFAQTHVHPTMSASVAPFSSCPQSFPAPGSFPMSRLFASGGQSIGASTSVSVLLMNSQCGKVMTLLLNTLSRLVTDFLPRSKCLLISWLQSQSAVILETKKIKFATFSTFIPSICHKVMRPDAMAFFFFLLLSFKPVFSPSSRDSLVFLQFLSLEWYHLHI